MFAVSLMVGAFSVSAFADEDKELRPIDQKDIFNPSNLTQKMTYNMYVEDPKGGPATQKSLTEDNVLVVVRNGDQYTVRDYGEIFKDFTNGWGLFQNDFVPHQLFNDVYGLHSFPQWEIVGINGVPWQNTKWKDTIISDVKQQFAGDQLVTNPTLWETFTTAKSGNAWNEAD